ncbi:hypothetical protein [Erythrobacter aureus]|uniref:hypothetical protein n=1 Tax=Erythrobacter aureus TaxID=2182384 RepID=UPI0013B44232|nr:hypothetical protein [Erythrobacter aureus]
MKRRFLPALFLISSLIGCKADARLVSDVEDYLSDPVCWGGDLENRRGKLVLVESDKSATIYIVSSTCEIRDAVGENSILDHLSFLRIDGDEDVIREALGLSRNIRVVPNFISSSKLPEMQSPVFNVEFGVKRQENDGFQFFELTYLRVDDESRSLFSNLLDTDPH